MDFMRSFIIVSLSRHRKVDKETIYFTIIIEKGG